MTKRTDVLVYLIIAVILAPIIFFPFSSDLSIYILGGKTILNGGRIYVDFIDIKPPLIYYIAAFINFIFGASETGARVFDFAWQFITACSIIFVTGKLSDDKRNGYAAAIFYSLSYAALNYTQTLQCESLVALPLIWIFYLHITGRSIYSQLLKGLLAGFITSLKYPMGVVFIALIADDILLKRYSSRKFFISNLFMSFGLFTALIISSLALTNPEILHGYKNVLTYLMNYSSNIQFDFEFIKNSIKSLGGFFGDNYSLSLSFLAGIGVYKYFLNHDRKSKESDMLNLAIITAILLLLSVILERKMFIYHASRIYLPLSILAGSGFIWLYDSLRAYLKPKVKIPKTIGFVVLVTAIIFSPVTRWIGLMPGVFYYPDQAKYNQYYERDGKEALRKQNMEISNFLTNRSQKEDKVIIIGIGATPMYIYANVNNYSKFGISCLYYCLNELPEWKADFHKELDYSTWVIIQDNDNHPIITLRNLSSWEFINEDAKAKEILYNKYYLVKKIGHFFIFHKKQSNILNSSARIK